LRHEPAILTTSYASLTCSGRSVISNNLILNAWVMIFVTFIPVTCYARYFIDALAYMATLNLKPTKI
jgi:hypothetical protein